MIFYCDELDEIFIYLGDTYDGEILNRQWATSPWFDATLNIEIEKDFVLIGYL